MPRRARCRIKPPATPALPVASWLMAALFSRRGRRRRLGNGDRAGSPRPGHLALQTVLRRFHRIRRRAEHACFAGRCRDAGHAACDQRGMRPPGGAQRLGLNAQINLRSVFDRKNYFYPDSPQGYQISQYKSPIVGEGEVTIELAGGDSATIGIERLHLEQDAGKSLHDQSPNQSDVDLNRCGVALMEIVSKPDIRSSEQAKAYVSKLRSILRYLGTCDGDME